MSRSLEQWEPLSRSDHLVPKSKIDSILSGKASISDASQVLLKL